MKTVTKTAFANLRQNNARNILTGIAIALTTLLIYLILTIGFGAIKLEFKAVNEIFPNWHFMYRDVNESEVQAVKRHAAFEKLGLRSDLAQTEVDEAAFIYVYMDKPSYELNNTKLSQGSYPVEAEDITISENTLKALGRNGKVGDYIELPYQLYEADGLGLEKKGRFRICGILTDSEADNEQKTYGIFVSKAFLDKMIPEADRSYRVYCRIAGSDDMTSDNIEQTGKKIADNFKISEENIVFNNEYLLANYVDPAFYTGMAIIILIVAIAGFLTIYSIYFVSMIHKVQEYGKLKALGATKKQIWQIVFREGMLVCAVAIPVGLMVGILSGRSFFQIFYHQIEGTNAVNIEIMKLLKEGSINLIEAWIVAAASGISLITVVLSLLKPMRTAGKISVIEAIRFNHGSNIGRKLRAGYTDLNLFRLTAANLSRYKKRTAVTVIALGATGALFIGTATILNCAQPKEIARDEFVSDYQIYINSDSGNQMHPERAWMNIQQNNPLNNSFENKVRKIYGVKKIIRTQMVSVKLKDYLYSGKPWESSIRGLGEEFKGALKRGQKKGAVTYEELLKGNKILVSSSILHWFPKIKVGDVINMTVENGNDTIQKDFEIGAICDYPYSVTQGSDFILPSGVIDKICSNNMTYTYEITADKNNKNIEDELKYLVDNNEFLKLDSYQEHVKTWRNSIGLMSKAGYALIIILAAVGVMNLINTMINSVYTRKRELGIMQAVGLSVKQLIKMLQMEGLFYTIGTLAVSLIMGNIAGYSIFLYAKGHDLMNISRYHYPINQTIWLILTVFLIQMLLSVLISRSINKQSLIEIIRFSE